MLLLEPPRRLISDLISLQIRNQKLISYYALKGSGFHNLRPPRTLGSDAALCNSLRLPSHHSPFTFIRHGAAVVQFIPLR